MASKDLINAKVKKDIKQKKGDDVSIHPKPLKPIKTIKEIVGYNHLGVKYSLGNVDAYKGIYAIGIDDPDVDLKDATDTVVLSKIGLGGLTNSSHSGLLKRIKSYYIAFPDGVWIYSLLLTLKKDPKFLRTVEKEIHAILEKKRYKSQYLTNLRKPEWFKCSIKDIRNAMTKVHLRYPDETFIMFPSEV